MRRDGRLTRGGRLIRTALGMAVLTGALLFGPKAFADGSGQHVPVLADTYTVATGETLWSIAAAVAPDAPTDATVRLIMDLNDMASASLRAGEQILVPVSP